MCGTVKHSVKDGTKAQLLGSVLFFTLAGTASTACPPPESLYLWSAYISEAQCQFCGNQSKLNLFSDHRDTTACWVRPDIVFLGRFISG